MSAHDDMEWERWLRSLPRYPEALARFRLKSAMQILDTKRARQDIRLQIKEVLDEAKMIGVPFT